ncbi:hypothetical protein GH714_013098 [Hevea brasiliensis]|uniref:Uncharacterized protein n=1 Tax=Hevea brasiliensis TaxID=3981 RepID=A0A6A6MMJ9_HEVBR|nr:hypothetical protein GH714_013098 [Hevea brasiliensis]
MKSLPEGLPPKAITRKLSTTNPTTMPTATAAPVFKFSATVDVFLETLVRLVAVAVGFSVGIEGKGDKGEVPVVDELSGGAGGGVTGGIEVDGTEGGGDVDVGGGGEFVTGGGLLE